MPRGRRASKSSIKEENAKCSPRKTPLDSDHKDNSSPGKTRKIVSPPSTESLTHQASPAYQTYPGDTLSAGNPFDEPQLTHQFTHPSNPAASQLPRYPMHNKLPPPQGPGGASSQKVYPPNQPMVFNPSNPNAPPIYPCGICHKEVHDNDQAILCESGCNFWYHRRCTGLTEPAYQMLTAEVYAEWVCDTCLQTKDIPLVKMKS